MKPFNWSDKKNDTLKSERLVSFEDVVIAISEHRLLDVIEHPNRQRYGDQKIYIIRIENYVYLVPYIEDDHAIYLKTIIPSRKATRTYLGGKNHD